MATLDELRRRFADNDGLPFCEVLSESSIQAVLDDHKVEFRDRVFTPQVTIWGFLSQILSEDHSCRDAVSRIIAHRVTNGNRGVSMSHRLLELRRYIQGWVGYFSLVPMKTYFENLDRWVRRRIRSCYWKQWRNPRTRIRNLRKLGVRRDQAVTHGFSSKGAWVMSSSQAVHEALSIAYLTQEGLVSLLTIWQKLTARN